MEVHGWKKEDGHSCSGFMVTVDEIEAIQIAENLLNQIRIRACNHGRLEMYTKDGEYFSIAVHSNKDANDNFFRKLIT